MGCVRAEARRLPPGARPCGSAACDPPVRCVGLWPTGSLRAGGPRSTAVPWRRGTLCRTPTTRATFGSVRPPRRCAARTIQVGKSRHRQAPTQARHTKLERGPLARILLSRASGPPAGIRHRPTRWTASGRKPGDSRPAPDLAAAKQPTLLFGAPAFGRRVDGHGRNARCRAPPVQSPACGVTAPGSCLGSNTQALIRPGMTDTRLREPAVRKACHTCLAGFALLAAAAQHPPPHPVHPASQA